MLKSIMECIREAEKNCNQLPLDESWIETLQEKEDYLDWLLK